MRYAPKLVSPSVDAFPLREAAIPTELVEDFHYQIVVLRADMLDEIRQIVREEINVALQDFGDRS